MPNENKDLSTLTWHELVSLVEIDWKRVYFGAVPYLNAMKTMESHNSNYGLDDGQTIIIYFLANATTWRGVTARSVKAELKRRAGLK